MSRCAAPGTPAQPLLHDGRSLPLSAVTMAQCIARSTFNRFDSDFDGMLNHRVRHRVRGGSEHGQCGAWAWGM